MLLNLESFKCHIPYTTQPMLTLTLNSSSNDNDCGILPRVTLTLKSISPCDAEVEKSLKAEV